MANISTEKPEGKTYTEREVAEMLARRSVVPRLAYSRKDAAAMLSIRTRTLDHLVIAKKMRVRRIWGRTIIPATELNRLIHQDTYRTAAPEEPAARRSAWEPRSLAAR